MNLNLCTNSTLYIELCTRSNVQYQDIRNRHYVPNKGCQGQQLHFLIYYNEKCVGIISGASSVYGVLTRDKFFNIPKNQHLKQLYYLPAIINNVVFRLEEHVPNLGTQILKLWRNTCVSLWEKIYKIPVIGFETFVVESDIRKGCMYLADNWVFCGSTFGSTKEHNGLINKSKRKLCSKKLIYCRYVHQKPIIPTVPYVSSWRSETSEQKNRAKHITNLKNSLIGSKYYKT